ncbi:MAG: hypothetical protein HKN78_06370 [Sphingomonadaceae bacterium]|nr:hypothetical protein [Sphingomonadaceae bacterium]
MTNPITQHLNDVGESYAQHFVAASGFGMRMTATGIACVLHAIFPFLFVQTGSEMVRRLHGEMVTKRADTLHQDWVI